MHAGFGGERVTERRLLFEPERATAEHGGGLGEVDLIALERCDGRDELVEGDDAFGV